MIHRITVEPLGPGWAVRADALDNPMIFFSGAQAELAARHLGERLANAGLYGVIEVRLRGGALGGRYLCPPVRADQPSARPPLPELAIA